MVKKELITGFKIRTRPAWKTIHQG